MKRLVISLFTCLFAALPLTATAQSMHSLQALADAAPNSEVYAGQVMWIGRHWTEYNVTSYASAVRLNKYWGITAGHIILPSGNPPDAFTVGVGSNWMNNQGETREVVEWHTHPTWAGTWNGQAVDLAVFRWEEPLEGEDLEIGALSINELFEYVGFGTPATPSTGLLPKDGQRRGFDAKVQEWGFWVNGISTDYVRSTFYNPGPDYLPMGGAGTGGGSGSPAFNAAGQLVAIANAQNGSPNYLASTYGLRLTLYADWILEKTYVAPEDPKVPATPVRLCRDGKFLTLSGVLNPQLYNRCRRQLIATTLGTAVH